MWPGNSRDTCSVQRLCILEAALVTLPDIDGRPGNSRASFCKISNERSLVDMAV
jgi:hypothetical protein